MTSPAGRDFDHDHLRKPERRLKASTSKWRRQHSLRRLRPQRSLDLLIQALPFLIVPLYVQLAPYTKVEESFNLHAIHDFMKYGNNGVFDWKQISKTGWLNTAGSLRSFDHVEHPGPVTRSFIPAILIASISKAILLLCLKPLGIVTTGLGAQKTVRTLIGLGGATSLYLVSQAIRRATRRSVEANLFTLLSITQFHIPFYASRTLPNFLAFPLVTASLALVLRSAPLGSKSQRNSLPESRSTPLGLLTALLLISWTCSVIRAEIALLLAGLGLTLWYRDLIPFPILVITVASGGLAGAAGSVLLDSRMWGKWTWPEMDGIIFNVVNGKSAAWGVSPWHTYLSSSIPKTLLFSLPLCIFALVDVKARRALTGWKSIILVPCVTMLAGLSALGHKEWRFMAYCVPWLNVVAAFAGAQLWQSPHKKGILSKIPQLVILGGLSANVLISTLIAVISMYNYPGGVAVSALHHIIPHNIIAHARIYFTHWPLMTGASLFTFEDAIDQSLAADLVENPTSRWEYNKTESLAEASPKEIWDNGFDFVVAESWFGERAGAGGDTDPWIKVQDIVAFGGLRRNGYQIQGIDWKSDVGIWAREDGLNMSQLLFTWYDG